MNNTRKITTTTTTTTSVKSGTLTPADTQFLLDLKDLQNEINNFLEKEITPNITLKKEEYIKQRNWIDDLESIKIDMIEEQENYANNPNWKLINYKLKIAEKKLKILNQSLAIYKIYENNLNNFQKHLNSFISDPHSVDKINNLITWFEYLQKTFEKLIKDKKLRLKVRGIDYYSDYLEQWKNTHGSVVEPGPLEKLPSYSRNSKAYKDIYYSLIYNIRLDENARRKLKEKKESIKLKLMDKLSENLSKAEKSNYIKKSLNFHDKKIYELKLARHEEKREVGEGLRHGSDPDDQMKFFWKEDKDRFEKELLKLNNSVLKLNSQKLLNFNIKKYKEKRVNNLFHSRKVTSERLERLERSELEESEKIKVLKTEYEVLSTSSPKGMLTTAIGKYFINSNINSNINSKKSPSLAEQTPNVSYAKQLLIYIDEFERSSIYKMAKIFNLGEEYDFILKKVGELAHQLILSPDNISVNDMVIELKKINNFDKRYPKLSGILNEIQRNNKKEKNDNHQLSYLSNLTYNK